MHTSYKIHSTARPPRWQFLDLLPPALLAALALLLGLVLSATAAQAQTVVSNVVLGPPRVETVEVAGAPPVTFWWAEVTGSGLESTCATRQDFDFAYGPYALQPVTNGIVYQVMDEAGTDNQRKALVAAVVNSTDSSDPIRFVLEYVVEATVPGCLITGLELDR